MYLRRELLRTTVYFVALAAQADAANVNVLSGPQIVGALAQPIDNTWVQHFSFREIVLIQDELAIDSVRSRAPIDAEHIAHAAIRNRNPLASPPNRLHRADSFHGVRKGSTRSN